MSRIIFDWQTLVSFRNSPVRNIALPASVIVPFLAAAFGYLQAGESVNCTSFVCELIRSAFRDQYAPLWFWYYIASLIFAAFFLVVEATAPETIKRYHDGHNYLDEVVRSFERANTTHGPGGGWSAEQIEAELTRSRKMWSAANYSRLTTRTICSSLFLLSVFIILFGTFVYVPAKVLSYDDLWRLFQSYFFLAT